SHRYQEQFRLRYIKLRHQFRLESFVIKLSHPFYISSSSTSITLRFGLMIKLLRIKPMTPPVKPKISGCGASPGARIYPPRDKEIHNTIAIRRSRTLTWSSHTSTKFFSSLFIALPPTNFLYMKLSF